MSKNQIFITISIILIAGGLTVISAVSAASSSTMEQIDSGGVCEGSPEMNHVSLVSPQNTITADQPAVIEANFHVDPTVPSGCTVVIDLQHSINASGFQFGSGYSPGPPDIATASFSMESGEVQTVRADIFTMSTEVKHEAAVISNYEIWYEGDRVNSTQVNGLRNTVDVEKPNGSGVTTEGGNSETSKIFDMVRNNSLVIGLVISLALSLVVLIKREAIEYSFHN